MELKNKERYIQIGGSASKGLVDAVFHLKYTQDFTDIDVYIILTLVCASVADSIKAGTEEMYGSEKLAEAEKMIAEIRAEGAARIQEALKNGDL